MANSVAGTAASLLFTFILYPLGILNLIWMTPVLALWRIIAYLVTPRKNVRGKVVIVTGASSGIGEHIAFEFAKKGAKLVLAARRVDRLKTVAETCSRLGSPDVEIVQADVRKEGDCKEIIDHAVRKFQRIDILVNNAGVAHSFMTSDAPNFKLESAREVIDTTMWGQVYPTYYALPHLKATHGQLLNIISVASYIPYPRQAFYNAAKHAAIGFFDTLRAEVGNRVTITNILPGWVASEMTEGKLLNTEDKPSWDTGLRDEHVGPWPVVPTSVLAKKAVETALKRERMVIVPLWYSLFLYFRVLTPEILDWSFKSLFMQSGQPGKSAPTKKMVQMLGRETINMPAPGTQKEVTQEMKARTWDDQKRHEAAENGNHETGSARGKKHQ